MQAGQTPPAPPSLSPPQILSAHTRGDSFLSGQGQVVTPSLHPSSSGAPPFLMGAASNMSAGERTTGGAPSSLLAGTSGGSVTALGGASGLQGPGVGSVPAASHLGVGHSQAPTVFEAPWRDRETRETTSTGGAATPGPGPGPGPLALGGPRRNTNSMHRALLTR